MQERPPFSMAGTVYRAEWTLADSQHGTGASVLQQSPENYILQQGKGSGSDCFLSIVSVFETGPCCTVQAGLELPLPMLGHRL